MGKFDEQKAATAGREMKSSWKKQNSSWQRNKKQLEEAEQLLAGIVAEELITGKCRCAQINS